jgi:hypothetical protein
MDKPTKEERLLGTVLNQKANGQVQVPTNKKNE